MLKRYKTIKKDLKSVSEMLDTNVEEAKETLIQLSDHFESVRMHLFVLIL